MRPEYSDGDYHHSLETKRRQKLKYLKKFLICLLRLLIKLEDSYVFDEVCSPWLWVSNSSFIINMHVLNTKFSPLAVKHN